MLTSILLALFLTLVFSWVWAESIDLISKKENKKIKI